MKHLDVRDLVGGVVLIAIGLFVALFAATHYQIGQPARIGPGFFPVALGWVLAGLGLIIVLLAFRKTVHVLPRPPFAPRPLIAVLASILAFSVLINHLGLVPATLALTLIVGLAERKFRWRRTLLLGGSLALFTWLLFIVGLKMTLPAFTFPG